MDNTNPHLTPNKIQRLMHLAEDKSFNLHRRVLTTQYDVESNLTRNQTTFNQTGTNCESSGILDLERIEGLCESGLESISLSKSSAFNPGEMTGRSTEAVNADSHDQGSSRAFQEYGTSIAIDNLLSDMNKQTSEIEDVMRYSVASNYSFHSKRDLTADEASLVIREAPLPVQHSTQINLQDSTLLTGSDMSMYFKNRCPEFGKILGATESPYRPSVSEVSTVDLLDASHNKTSTFAMDQTLDCIPVRQPRLEKTQEKTIPSNLFPSNADLSIFAVPKPQIPGVKPNKMNKSPVHCKDTTNLVGSKTVTKNLSQKPLAYPLKHADILRNNLQSSSHFMSDDTECSVENSLSISKIADYLEKESLISVSGMLQLNNQNKQMKRKQPLKELQVNVLQNNEINKETYVTNLKDTKKSEAASSSGTVNTVISLEKLKISDKDLVRNVVNSNSLNTQSSDDEELRSPRAVRSPSCKSYSTLSTVQENIASFKSGQSPLSSSKVDPDTSRIPSPNLKYRELDNSVNWYEVLNRKRFNLEGVAKEQWAQIRTNHVEGFVGVSVPVTISVTTLTDSWLTAKFVFDDLSNHKDNLTVELPRFPLLLSPKKTEKFTIHISSNIETDVYLPFTMHLKDTAIDGDLEQKGNVGVSFKMPAIQALSCDGVNKVNYPQIQENSSVTKPFVLISDCPVDLQLELSISIGDSVFFIKSVQGITKSDVSKVLMDRSGTFAEDVQVRAKKGINKQLCRLGAGNAIKVAVTFSSPKLSESEFNDQVPTFNGILNVNLIGVNTVLKTVSMTGSVGSACLVIQHSANKLLLTNEPTTLNLCNTGNISGVWAVKFRSKTGSDGHFPFKVSANKVKISPGAVNQLKLVYLGAPDVLNEGTLILEDISNGNVATIDITGGSDKPKTFPIKSNYNSMSWVRAGRKELSLKNSSDQKVQIWCQIKGEGFKLDCPGVESRGTYILSFGPCECRPLSILFAPNSCLPHAAALHLVLDKNSDYSRKIKLHGSANNDLVRWSGLITYSDTALVSAVPRRDVELQLYNRAAAPAFLAARVHFNLQYRCVAAESALAGARRVLARRGAHSLALRVPWPRLARRAGGAALATVSVLAGPEFTRRRILKILKDESSGAIDVSLLPEHLRVLAEPFEGEDAAMDSFLQDFDETKASLNELIEGLQELTAQIDLPQDIEDHTILITEDTVIEHHTLCD